MAAKQGPKRKYRGIYKRNTGMWWIRYAGLDGKTRYESSGSKSFKDAQALLIQRKKAIQDGKEPLASTRIGNNSFRGLSEHYLIWAERQKSYRRKKGIVGIFNKKYGNLPLRRFNTMLVEEYQTEVLNEGKATGHG